MLDAHGSPTGVGMLEVVLPAALAHLANTAGVSNTASRRYQFAAPVAFAYRSAEWQTRVTGRQAVRYDLSFDPAKGAGRWYLDASWGSATTPAPDPSGAAATAPFVPLTLDQARKGRVLGVDLNAGHLAAFIVDAAGNPVGSPFTIPLVTRGLAGPTRDARVRHAVTTLLELAASNGCLAVAVENLNFTQARLEGNDGQGAGARHGSKGRTFRALVAGLPTAQLRDRLAAMATRAGVTVIAVDPAYSSQWGRQHWAAPTCGRPVQTAALPGSDTLSAAHVTTASSHHGAAVVLGRRALGHGARRTTRTARTTSTTSTGLVDRVRAASPVEKPRAAPEDASGTPITPSAPTPRQAARPARPAHEHPARTSAFPGETPAPDTP